MYRKLCFVSFFVFLIVVSVVNAEIERFAAYDAELWKNIDDRLQKINLNRLCVLPFEPGSYVFETEPYRGLIESQLIKLHDRTYKVICRNFDDIKKILDNILPVEKEDADRFYRYQMEMGLTRLEDYKYQVLTRDKDEIQKLLKVIDFDISDLVDPNTAARIGRMIGTESVLLFKEFEKDSVKFQIIHTESARILFKGIGERDKARNYAVWKED